MHNIDYLTYPEKVDKKIVQSDGDRIAAVEGRNEGTTQLPNPIRWIDKVFDSYKEAEEYIKSIDRGWYDQIAVKFKQYPEVPDNEKLRSKYIELLDKRTAYCRDTAVNKRKAEYISCPQCGSRLKRELMRFNKCPLCSAELRSKSVMDTIAAYDEKIERARAAIYEDNLKRQQKLKPNIKWLVKIEYHT